MVYGHENILYQENLPLKIFTQTVEAFPYHWHEEVEVLLILEGSVKIKIDKKEYILNQGEIFLINHNELHEIESLNTNKKAQLLALQIDVNHMKKYGIDLSTSKFKIQSGLLVHEEASENIRSILADMMDMVLNKKDYIELRIEKKLIELMMILVQYFKVIHEKNQHQSRDERLLEILKYIREHCHLQSLSLNEIAEHFYLTPQYLSRYFKNEVGISIKKFMDQLRLNQSLFALKTTNERVLDIALSYGFSDAKAYYRVFKEVFGTTPTIYRNQHQIESSGIHHKNYFNINSQESLKTLFQYQTDQNKNYENLTVQKSYQVYLNKVRIHNDKKYMKLLTFGYGPHGLRPSLQSQIKEIQSNMPFSYVRFHGIFSDDFEFYKLTDNKASYNFEKIDALIDFFLDQGLKPFLELGFTPTDLASNDVTLFYYQVNVSPPKDLNLWRELIVTCMYHWIDRYGLEEVKSWYFEVWNEPEIEDVFWAGNQDQFFELYHVTYESIKAIDEDFKVGGFSNILFLNNYKWLSDFNDYAIEHKIGLDFFTFHTYLLKFGDNQIDIEDVQSLTGTTNTIENMQKLAKKMKAEIGGPNYLYERTNDIINGVKPLEAIQKEYIITEWNASMDSQDGIHDTCYMATYIVKQVLNMHESLSAMGYWTLSDIFEEHGVQDKLFHGGFGLMTINGLKKPAYHAYDFLNQLGNQIIMKDNHFILTESDDGYQLLCYHYIHTNTLYNQLDHSQMTESNRYRIFESNHKLFLRFEMIDFEDVKKIKRQRVNRMYGSSFDAWVDMGAPEQLTNARYNTLKEKSQAKVTYDKVGSILEVTLEPHEIQLITWPKNKKEHT